MKRFGNRWSDLLAPLVFFAVVALIIFVALVAFGSQALEYRVVRGAEIALFLFLVPTACVTPTLIFELVVDETHITHRAFERYVLSRKRIEDLTSAEFAAGGWGAKLTFRDGTAIRFLGAHLGILSELKEHLERVAPQGARFD